MNEHKCERMNEGPYYYSIIFKNSNDSHYWLGVYDNIHDEQYTFEHIFFCPYCGVELK